MDWLPRSYDHPALGGLFHALSAGALGPIQQLAGSRSRESNGGKSDGSHPAATLRSTSALLVGRGHRVGHGCIGQPDV